MQRGWLGVQVLGAYLVDVVAREVRLPRRQLVQHHPERVQVFRSRKYPLAVHGVERPGHMKGSGRGPRRLVRRVRLE